MKVLSAFLSALIVVISVSAQDVRQQIYETERAFEKMAAERGVSSAFIEYLSPTGVMFMPDAVYAREAWKARAGSTAFLTWNPIWIDVSSNGLLAYSVGNSKYRAKGKDETTVHYGHYLSIWQKQPDGRFLAAFDTGINHPQPSSQPTEWSSPTDSGQEKNPNRLSAADSAVSFYEMAAGSGPGKAYKTFLAEDAIVMRQGKIPAFSRKAALPLVESGYRINFAKRKSFIEAVDLAYVHARYTINDKKGSELEKGNFVQVWKLRGRKWLIVADLLSPLPK